MFQGLLNLDKPLNVTSHDVVARVRRLSDMRRVGHGGTLDPLATGVLVVALGRATRLLEYVVGQPKVYRAVVRLGEVTTTYDGEGQVVARHPVTVSREDVERALGPFRGEIEQVPPMYSALKKAGTPLYELARRGIEVEREARQVTIYDLELLTWEPPLVTLHVHCSTGTYIRSLAHDLGQALGCGGYLDGLRRMAVGHFTVKEATPVAHLSPENLQEHVQPLDSAVSHLAPLTVPAEAAARLAQGQWLERKEGQPDGSLVRAYDDDGRFVGVLQTEGDAWRPRKIFYEV